MELKHGCIREAIFSSIPTVPDILHLFLRISDVLTNVLILELRRLDGIEKQVRALNRDKAANMTQHEHFLNHQCKISFQWYINKESKTLQWRDLQDPRNINCSSISIFQTSFHDYQNHRNCRNCGLISCRSTIFLRKIDDPNNEEIDFEQMVCMWLEELFLSLFQTKHVTSYIHILVSHVPDFSSKGWQSCSVFTTGS